MAMHRLGLGVPGSSSFSAYQTAFPAYQTAQHPAPDPVEAIEQACARLQRQRPQSLTAYRVNQSSQALMGSSLRLAASAAVPPALLYALAVRLVTLSGEEGPGPQTAALASEILRQLLSLSNLATVLPRGTAHSLVQARSDAVYLAAAATEAPAGRAAPPNQLAACALELARLSRAAPRAPGPDAPVAAALRWLGADLLGIAANAGGAEMPAEVQAQAAALIGGYAALLWGRETLVRAAAVMTARLRGFVASLVRATGGSYGTQHGLASLSSDIGVLDAAVRNRLSLLSRPAG